jgi:hypothetical protein
VRPEAILPWAVWEFAHPWLSVGFILAAIPILLYLLERRRTPTVDWPAMRFFLGDLERAIRWMELREILLIVLRSAIIALVVLVLMRPLEVRSRSALGAGGGSRGVLILLDNSYSMAGRDGDGHGATRWEAARAAALRIIEGLGSGDLVQVAALSPEPTLLSPAPLSNHEDAKACLREAALAGRSGSIPAGLELAAERAASLPTSGREIYLLTDLQDRGWSLGDAARWSALRGRLDSLRPSPRRVLLQFGSAESVNRAVVSVGTSRQVVGTDRPVEVLARLARFGEASERSVQASLAIDGVGQETRSVALVGGKPAEVRFRHRFTAPGSHRVEVRLEPDLLPEDDLRPMVLDVLDQLPVLIVTGDGAGARPGAASLIDLALAPRAAEGAVPPVLFRPRVAGFEEFTALRGPDLQGYRVVVLDDVPALDPASAARLEDWVRAGGGLLVFAGARAGGSAYDQDLFRSGRGLLPLKLTSLETAAGTEEPSPRLLLSHPALAELGDAAREELSRVRVRRFWRTEAAAGAAIIAELKPGIPYLAEKPFGRGRVLLATSGVDREGSDLAQRPLFVPLVHGLAYHLAERDDHRNVLLGAALEDPLDLQPGETLALTDPAGTTRAVVPAPLPDGGPRTAVSFGTALLPGFYTLKVNGPKGERSVTFAAAIDPLESDLRRVGAEGTRRLAEAGFTIAPGLEEIPASGPALPVTVEHWREPLALVVALVLLEVLLTRSFGRGRAPWRPQPASPVGQKL